MIQSSCCCYLIFSTISFIVQVTGTCIQQALYSRNNVREQTTADYNIKSICSLWSFYNQNWEDDKWKELMEILICWTCSHKLLAPPILTIKNSTLQNVAQHTIMDNIQKCVWQPQGWHWGLPGLTLGIW